MNKIQPFNSNKNSLNIKIAENEIHKSESDSSEFSITTSHSCESHLNNINQAANQSNRKLSTSIVSLNLPYQQVNQTNHSDRKISSSPVKRRVSQDSGVVSNRGYISCYNVSTPR